MKAPNNAAKLNVGAPSVEAVLDAVEQMPISDRDAPSWLLEADERGDTSDVGAPSDGNAAASEAAPVDPFEVEVAATLAEVTAKLGGAKTAKLTPLFGTDAVELLHRSFDGARWLVTGLITRLGITMIGAEPKAAKTWLGTEIAVAVATGTKVCGEFFAELGNVAYFYAEDMDVQIRNRIRALLSGGDRRLATGRLHLEPRGTFIDLLEDRHLAWLIASARRHGALDLLVLDPLRDIHSGEEDKSDSMRDVMRRLRLIAEMLSCTVAVIHHAPKSSKDNAGRRPGQNLRGSSAIHGAVDCGLYLTDSDGDGANLFVNKVTSQVKGARSAGPFKLEMAVTDDTQGEAVEARWTFSREIGSRSAGKQGADDQTTYEFVRELAVRGEVLSRTALRAHDSRPLSERRVIAALDRLIECKRLALRDGRVAIPHFQECSPSD